MEIIAIPLVRIALIILKLYSYCVIGQVILSWLLAFGVVNRTNQFVYQVRRVLDALVEPLLSRIRGFIPMIGGVDLSPLILLLAIWFFQYVLEYLLFTL